MQKALIYFGRPRFWFCIDHFIAAEMTTFAAAR
jgi:hypothetical protein